MKTLKIKVALLLWIIFIAIPTLQAQEEKTVLEINSSIKNTPCNLDSAQRNYLLEKKDNNIASKIVSISGKGCQLTTSQNLSMGNYLMTISCFGFEDQTVNFEVTENNKTKIVFNTINLKEKINSLNEVVIYGNKRQFVKIESDKTTVKIKDNAMLNTGSGYEALKRLPGVITSPTKSLTLNGKGVTVYIDGSPSTLSGTDLENYLSSLPANAIEKVELVYNPGASYEANSSGSVINVITSSRHMKGLNASFNINYNFNKYQKPSPQILLNGKEKNLSWQTMLGYNYIDSEEKITTAQAFTSFSPTKNLLQENFKLYTNRNAYFRLGTNYKLNTKSNLLFNYNNTFANDRINYLANTLGEGINFNDNGITKNKSANQDFSLQYKTKLDTIGRTLDVTAFVNTFNRNPINESTTSESQTNNSNIDFGLTNYYLKYDFAIPFNKMNFSINTGGKYNTIKVNDLGRYKLDNTTTTIDFNYTENNLAFYAEARKKINKFNFTAGLRFENFNIERMASTATNKINYKTTNLFPNVSASYEINSQLNLSANYSKKIKQPNYNTIDPNNSSAFNQYNSSAGDISLKSAFFDNYELKLTAFQFVQVGANYTIIKDNSQFVFNAKPGELISNQTYQSFDKMNTFSAYVSFPIPLDYFFKGKDEFMKRMNTIDKMNYVYVNLNYMKTKTDGYDFSFSNKAIVNLSLQSQIILPWNITNTMAYSILSKGTWEVYQVTKPIQQFDISFNKDFMDKKMKVGLHCFDVFNKNETNGLITGQNLETQYHQKKDSRFFRLSLTYNFGNSKLQKENTEIQNEKIQQSSGGLGK
ncbi:TonB-dependent receptor domain-containing protein [Flavobacterium soyangense]|uniref:TonB-dependent receptor n=1 Tax=Flavobacterium soyangense TaxID=2023265 RepID=A0A930UCX7_9FLAO|nr:outer membrane beta-barrel family protein [Flavobacterium soyangense]MBF2709897.1 TonB-dependent receptor [Flavobacterium soyangense]